MIEFKQGMDPYKTMCLGEFQEGERVILNRNLDWDSIDRRWKDGDERNIVIGDVFKVMATNITYRETFSDFIIRRTKVDSVTGIKVHGGKISANKWFSYEDANKFLERA
jgi:hypothetical protein